MNGYQIKRGSTLRLVLERTSGDFTGVTVTASLKESDNRGLVPNTSSVVCSFEVTELDHIDPADDASNPGWELFLSDEKTAILDVGRYFTDCRLEWLSGDVYYTDTTYLDVDERVTEAS